MEVRSTKLVAITLQLPERVVFRIRKDLEGSKFRSIEDLIESLIMQKFPEEQDDIYSKDEKKLIEERLERLGYF